MQLDLEGRVKNVPERFMSNKPYMPLYEAIINSIQAIKEAKNDEGEIRVRIIREPSLIYFIKKG